MHLPHHTPGDSVVGHMHQISQMERQQQHRWLFTAVNIILLIVAVFFIQKLIPLEAPKQVSYSEFLADLRSGKLSDVQITERELIGILKDDSNHSTPATERTIKATRLPGVDESLLLKELEAQPVKFGGHIESPSWIWSALAWLLPFAFIALIYGVGMRRIAQVKGPLTFGKNQAKIYDQSSRVPVTFEDVAGVDEAKLELEEVVDFLRQPAKYQKLGGRIPKGVLLVGPPF